MLYIETDKVTYIKIKTLLPELKPDIKIILLSCDDNLERLGFCKSAPCVVGVDLSSTEKQDLLELLIDIESNAYSSHGGKRQHVNRPYYQKYMKYGWLFEILLYAEEGDSYEV